MELCNLTAINSETCSVQEDCIKQEENIVSFHSKVPLPLQIAMNNFIERYPNWDQYRLIQAALAGFLVQQGILSRDITRLYVGNMFALNSFRKTR